ncbi:hypothetical protein Hsw_2948 [Hymenobacter swuensis DY53]|uniref:Uncharacterized protein n=1 Tax=Hymenobacter swuensis DY53 TaxID=1227739 RepID=W8F0W8_9BACT|nr:hypothetical protein Hsw_2948 [Hymenobacter swuensis DY53]
MGNDFVAEGKPQVHPQPRPPETVFRHAYYFKKLLMWM